MSEGYFLNSAIEIVEPTPAFNNSNNATCSDGCAMISQFDLLRIIR